MKAGKHYTEIIDEAEAMEAEGDLKKAAALYEAAIKQKPFHEKPYDRLMTIYRKLKDYKKEVQTIDKALALFKEHYDKKAAPFTGNDKVGQLSKQLLASVTGSTKRTSYTTYPEPIPRWTVRKNNAEKKIK